MEPEASVPFVPQDNSDINVRLLEDDATCPNNIQACDCRNDVGVESLDYEPIQSLVNAITRLKTPQRRHIYGYTGLTFTKWIITIFIGFLVGFVAYIIAYSQEFLITYKKTWIKRAINEDLAVAFAGYAASGICLVMISSCLVLYWAPAAAGGGVTLVMAYLNGNDIPELLRFTTLIAKIIGSICTIASGLPLGQEGPMVHIGAAIASTLTWMHGKFPSKTRNPNPRGCCTKFCIGALPLELYNDKDRREFISAGTAAGLAAAFGSPIGGVLYSLEEASSFWSRKVMWRSLVCTTVAIMTLSWLHEREFSFALPGSLAFDGLRPEFHIHDLPLFFITSVGAGILGAFVNLSHGWLANIRPPSSKTLARLVEACLVTLVSVTVIFVLPHFLGHCLETPDGKIDKKFFIAYTCPQQSSTKYVYNDLATLFLSVPHQTIQHLLQMGQNSGVLFSIRSLGIHTCFFLLLFILSYGIATPGGIFMPSMMVGASFGALTGSIFKALFPSANIQPGLHALVGATSMLGGLFRSTVSLVVIMVEGTGGIDFILPIIMAIVVSNWVAHHLHQSGAYEADLEQSGNVHFLQSEPPRELISLSAADIMSSNVIGFEEIAPIAQVLKVLRNTRHNGFPVYKCTNPEGRAQGGLKLVGLILRHQILLLLEQHVFIHVDPDTLQIRGSCSTVKRMQDLQFLEHAMRVYHHCHNPHRRDLSSLPEAVDALKLDDNEVERFEALNTVAALDFRPFMNQAPLTVRGECSAQRVYLIFRTLGLRHLCVIDSNNIVIGMITRKDIANAQREPKASAANHGSFYWSDDIHSSSSQIDEKANRDTLYNLP